MENYYQLLGIRQDATPSEIKEAYYKEAKKYHPDNHPNQSALEIEMMKKITIAYAVLSHEDTRQKYDATLKGTQSASFSFAEQDKSYTEFMQSFWKEYQPYFNDVDRIWKQAEEKMKERERRTDEQVKEMVRRAENLAKQANQQASEMERQSEQQVREFEKRMQKQFSKIDAKIKKW